MFFKNTFAGKIESNLTQLTCKQVSFYRSFGLVLALKFVKIGK